MAIKITFDTYFMDCKELRKMTDENLGTSKSISVVQEFGA
jgi:hypothetical protein